MIDSEVIVGTGLRVTVSRDALLAALGLVARGVSPRTSVLVLGGIRLHAEEGELELAATDMELSLRTSLEAELGDGGEAVVPGRLLLDIARALPDGEVTIEQSAEEAVVSIRSGSASYRLHTYSTEDFPRLPAVGDIHLHAVDSDALVETIGRVSRSASRD